ncbi:hypothetical protein ACR2Q2_19470 [Pectobacterium versatile]|uniref:Uncharacterized protein n=1 Tax=Pectobacterium parmentieri TaxID=1905730 RepID=A0ABS0S3A7_PECPM|nr:MULTISPECIES: hypothetical protein [Pectobacterium]AVT58159.1 Hypothetical protein OA04_15620 [Pectobacterium versatile]MBI0472382.1 hypothetical protein [Pectobacterium parmentieri]MBI0495049.1 hypothetical protein [Pectobacterium parmentieri]MBI0556361.1 hypothetical protein [Pectobacterium parmentieri]MBI0569507.1 hypothetical protein [Pectobacterium parmentieri]
MGTPFPVTLDEWNTALVKAIFFDPSCAGSTLSRIDATGRIFDEFKGFRSKDEAKRSFLDAFGKTPYQIRSRFKCSTKNAVLTQRDGIPPYFAALYLTLLSASADDDTYEVGDFRARFAILLGFSELQNFSFSDLPALWHQLADWSRRRKELKGDCAQLILPVPPASEKLIGHSKRLSFPCYKDENRLRDLLANEKLDSHSSFQKVNEAVHRQLFFFNEVFNYEVKTFNCFLLSASWQQAFNSPFWGAVRDITRHDEIQKIAENGRFCIQLDSTDVWNPEIYLLMDQKGADVLAAQEIYTLPQQISIYTKGYYQSDIDNMLIHLSILSQKQNKGLYQSRIGMALQVGCLPLFQDDSGYISSDGHYFDDGPVCLVINSGYVKNVSVACKNINLKFSSLELHSERDKWNILVFDAVSQQALTTLTNALPKIAQRFLIQSWMPARPRLTGGARFGQAVLLNPASTPFIRMEGANSGRFVISDSVGNELATGELSVSDEGLFISPEKLVSIHGQTLCRYLLTVDQQITPLIYDVHVLDHAPDAPYRRLKEPGNWLVDGPLGILVPLDDGARNESNSEFVNKQKLIPMGGEWSLWQQHESSPAERESTGLHSLPVALDWLTEALALRFQRRSTLPFDELDKHLIPVSRAISIPAWRLRRILFTSGFLSVAESRYTPYPLVIQTPRTISVFDEKAGAVARISGMMTKSERNQLQCVLADNEQINRWSLRGHDLAIGCIELNLSSVERAELLVEQFGLQLITKADFSVSPLGGVILPITQIENIPSLPVNINVSTWLEGKNDWSEESALIDQNSNSFVRCREKQRNRYFIITQNGYWQTDSFAWGLMVQTIFLKKTLGIQSHNGDLHWSKSLIALPLSLTQWWLHFAGGCLAIGDDGHVSFVGGGSSIWGEIDRSETTTQEYDDRAILRRSRALKLRRGR